MGVLIDYSKQRIDEIRVPEGEDGTLRVHPNKPALKEGFAVRVARPRGPVVGTRWEHKIEAMEGKT